MKIPRDPHCCPLRSCRRTGRCMGAKNMRCLADRAKYDVFEARRRLAGIYMKKHGRKPLWSLLPRPPAADKEAKQLALNISRVEFSHSLRYLHAEQRVMSMVVKNCRALFGVSRSRKISRGT
jgi:hypothetical protein